MNKLFYHYYAFALICFIGIFCFSVPAAKANEILTKIDVPTIASILQGLGLSYQSKYDALDRPRIVVDAENLRAVQLEVYFFDCDGEGACENITLWSWYSPEVPVRYLRTNVWNKKNRWVRAYLDEDRNPVLEMDINANGGLGRDNLALLMAAYVETMNAYADYIRAVK